MDGGGRGEVRVRALGPRGSLPAFATRRQLDVLAAYAAAGGSVRAAAAQLGIQPSTAKRHLADMRARFGLTTAELIYVGRAAGWLIVPSLEPTTRVPTESAA